jgi:hypothetical protein
MGLVPNRSSGLLTPGGVLLPTGELREMQAWERFGPMTAVSPGNPAACPLFREWVRVTITRRPEQLHWFLSGAIWQDERQRRLLVRTGLDRGDLGQLSPVLEATLGEYCVPMDYETWSRWPKGRGWELGEELKGRRLVFLTGMERWLRLPHQAVSELLLREQVQFWHDGGGWQLQPMPRYFILPGGSGRKSERVEEHVDRQMEALPPPDKEEGRPIDLSVILAAEAPHILAWLLTPMEGAR